MSLQNKYKELIKKYSLEVNDDFYYSGCVIRDSINAFMNTHKSVALYCYGAHTRALMTEYIYELKNIACIIDNGNIDSAHQGFQIIKDEEIESMGIDGIMISSYIYREEIKKSLKENHPQIDFLDFYDEIKHGGIKPKCAFFEMGTAYKLYSEINQLYQKIDSGIDVSASMRSLVEKFIALKDFRLAAQMAEELYKISEDVKHRNMATDIKRLHDDVLNVAAGSEDAVLLMCVDGLKAKEFCPEGLMHKTYSVLQKKATIFTQAYSYSTSTFESLVPVFSENYNQKSDKYMKSNTVPSTECRFMNFARKQGKNIYIYGNKKYIEDPEIKHREFGYSITQMIWSFLCDLESDAARGGMFYMQPVFESHFPFPNPYFRKKDMAAVESHLFFEYFTGRKVEMRYGEQYHSAIEYIDDTLAPFFERMKCKAVFFADHGNYDFEEMERTNFENMRPHDFAAGEELIRIPLAVISSDGGEESPALISLSEIHDIAISLMKGENYHYAGRSHVKIGRSETYNPDARYIYKQIFHSEHSMYAYDGFIFADGYKLIVFSDGRKELYQTEGDILLHNDELTLKYYQIVEKQVTV